MNLNLATAAVFVLGGLALSAAPAGASPSDGPWKTADSPTSVTHTGVGKATVHDADGIKFVVHYEDIWHTTKVYPAKACTTSWSITQVYPIEGQKFTVTDCKGNQKAFNFHANT